MQFLDKDKPKGQEEWKNPDAPSASVEDKRDICSFFVKTGACRFGTRCSRKHPHAGMTRTLLLKGMYSDYAMEQSFRDEYDTDISLEYDEDSAYQNFLEFYEDVLPEFRKIGKVVQFKVCCNWEQHLRGNVYVQFDTNEEALKALDAFNGRFYAGRQISCEYTGVEKWKSAICGMFLQKRCPKGKNCNFLHIFKNPRREFADADHDFQTRRNFMNRSASQRNHQPRSERGYTHRDHKDRYSTRYRGRSRSRSRSPRSERHSRSERKYRRRSHSRSRHRSRSRSRSRQKSRSPSRSQHRSRSQSRSRQKSRSPSKSRQRSRSRSRSRQKSRSRSKSRQRSRSQSRSRQKSRSRSRSKHRSKSRSRSQSRSKSRSRSRSRGRGNPSYSPDQTPKRYYERGSSFRKSSETNSSLRSHREKSTSSEFVSEEGRWRSHKNNTSRGNSYEGDDTYSESTDSRGISLERDRFGRDITRFQRTPSLSIESSSRSTSHERDQIKRDRFERDTDRSERTPSLCGSVYSKSSSICLGEEGMENDMHKSIRTPSRGDSVDNNGNSDEVPNRIEDEKGANIDINDEGVERSRSNSLEADEIESYINESYSNYSKEQKELLPKQSENGKIVESTLSEQKQIESAEENLHEDEDSNGSWSDESEDDAQEKLAIVDEEIARLTGQKGAEDKTDAQGDEGQLDQPKREKSSKSKSKKRKSRSPSHRKRKKHKHKKSKKQ